MKNHCVKDCELKKIFEDPGKYDYYLAMAASLCAGCIYFEKQDHFIQREEVKDPTLFNRISNTIKEFCIRGSG